MTGRGPQYLGRRILDTFSISFRACRVTWDDSLLLHGSVCAYVPVSKLYQPVGSYTKRCIKSPESFRDVPSGSLKPVCRVDGRNMGVPHQDSTVLATTQYWLSISVGKGRGRSDGTYIVWRAPCPRRER